MTHADGGRLLVVAQELVAGGAAYLAVRHIQRLSPHFAIDLVVTGPCDPAMLRRLPAGVQVFQLDGATVGSAVDSLGSADPLGALELILARRHIAPLQRSYRAVLATSVLRDWRACVAVSVAHAPRKLTFLVDETLAGYAALRPREQSAIDGCLLASDLVLSVSHRLWQRMAAACPVLARRPWQVLRPPLDVVDPASLPPYAPRFGPDRTRRDKPVVLTVARLVRDKEILQCLHIHHRLRQAGVDFRWYVIGTGPDEPRLRAEVDRLGMADAFRLVGDEHNPQVWMRQSDVFALFSSSEGCPMVVMEALRAGCAVIATDVNGVDELIDNGRTGLIVPHRSEAIAAGLARLVQDAGLRAQLRRALAAAAPVEDAAEVTAQLLRAIEVPATHAAAPTVSILIPTHNHERYIERAIAGALMQDYPALEVVVVDDASTDRTADLVDPWKRDPRFRYVRNARNLGRVANYRQALTEHARGDWVMMLDGDDHLVDPGFIRHAVAAIQRHANRAIVFAQAGHRVHDAAGHRPDVDVLPPIDAPERVMAGGEYLHFVYATGFFTHLGALYHRRSAIAHDCYTAEISSSDMDSLLRLALEGDVLVLNTIAGCWVQHGGNSSANLPLVEIAANVRLFRRIARMAVRRGLTSMGAIDGVLTRYEAQTLAHLFSQTLGRTARGPFAVLRMVSIAISINPRLLLSLHLAGAYWRSARVLTRATRTRWAAALSSARPFGKRAGGPP